MIFSTYEECIGTQTCCNSRSNCYMCVCIYIYIYIHTQTHNFIFLQTLHFFSFWGLHVCLFFFTININFHLLIDWSFTYLIVIQVQLSPISTHHFLLPQSGFVHSPSHMFLDGPPTSFSLYPSSPSPLFTVSLFFISKSLVIVCLFVCFVD